MEEAAASMYGVHYYPTPPPIAFSADCGAGDDLHALISRMPPPAASSHDRLKAQIASHPRYPLLLDAYIGCQKVHPSIPTVQFPSAKVGAPPEVSTLLDEIRRENDLPRRSPPSLAAPDPELDFFMVAYCDVLARYRTDLARPFDEATAFLNDMEEKLTGLCGARSNAPDCAGSSDDDLSSGELDVRDAQIKGEDKDLKDKLLRKYSGYLSSLKQEFSKKKKKGKLPKEARQALLDWWNIHYKWPYPTEADKIALAELTGLDQKQINNWFINQRKRHWKPSESMQIAVMDSLNTPYYLDG